MRRRDFISIVGGTATWPFVVRAQQTERVRRIGVLMSLGPDDPDGQARNAAFLQGLQQLGWTDGRNIQIDHRWAGAGDAENMRKYAGELVPTQVLVSLGRDSTFSFTVPTKVEQQVTPS